MEVGTGPCTTPLLFLKSLALMKIVFNSGMNKIVLLKHMCLSSFQA